MLFYKHQKGQAPKDLVDDEVFQLRHWIDAVHTAMMVYEEDGPGACDVFLMKTRLKHDTTFSACLQAMLECDSANKGKGQVC